MDAGALGRALQLQNAFGRILVASGDQNYDAAVFTNRADDFESKTYDYYFSPRAAEMASQLITTSGAKPCELPRPERLALAVGDARARRILFGDAGKN
jgi:hypothetical protein